MHIRHITRQDDKLESSLRIAVVIAGPGPGGRYHTIN